MPLWASNTGHCSSPENRHWKRTCPFLLPPSPSSHSREDPKHESDTLAQAPEWDVKPGLTINFLLSIYRKVELSDKLDKETQRFKRNFLHWGEKSSLCIRTSIHHYLRISLISSAWTLAFTSPIHSKIVRRKQLVLDTGFHSVYILSSGTFTGTRKGCKEGLSVSIPRRIVHGNPVLIPQQELGSKPKSLWSLSPN